MARQSKEWATARSALHRASMDALKQVMDAGEKLDSYEQSDFAEAFKIEHAHEYGMAFDTRHQDCLRLAEPGDDPATNPYVMRSRYVAHKFPWLPEKIAAKAKAKRNLPAGPFSRDELDAALAGVHARNAAVASNPTPAPVAAAPAAAKPLSPAKQAQLNAMLAEIAAEDTRKAEAEARGKTEADRLAELRATTRRMYGPPTPTTTTTKAATAPTPAPANDTARVAELRAAARAAKAAASAGYSPAARWAR